MLRHEMETVLMRKETELTTEEVFEILKSDNSTTTAVQPAHPEGGDIYILFKPEKKLMLVSECYQR